MRTSLIFTEFYRSLTKNQLKARPPWPKNKYAALYSTSADNLHSVSVADYYIGKSVFITGATGFIGMALIEKLLFSCKISKIYVLMRESDQLNAFEKTKKMLENPAFSRLKKSNAPDLNKIIPISGDIELPNLGINCKDEAILLEEVSVVFHSAATTLFNKPLKEALRVNYEGTKKVLGLCKKIKHIQAFVHISTAFSNTDKKDIEDKVYPPPADINDVYKYVERFGNDDVNLKEILNGRPNTYTFTKALTENFITENCGTIPSIIIRPSMVGPAMEEPFKGWLHNMSAPSNLLLAGGIGFNHVIRGSKLNITDFVPVDYVANLCIVSPTVSQRSGDVTVYNCGTGTANPLYLGEIFELFNKQRLKFTPNDLPLPKVFIIEHKFILDLVTFITQIIPAFILDLRQLIKGKSPRYVKRQRKFITMRDSVQYFTYNSWNLKTDKLKQLNEAITEYDRKTFPFDVTRVKWPEYMNSYANSIKEMIKTQNTK